MKKQYKHYWMLLVGFLFLGFGQVSLANPSPVSVQGAKSITGSEARALWLEGAFFVDPRSVADWEAGRIPGALHMESNRPVYNAQTVLNFAGSKEAPIVAYCNAEACHRAAHLARDLVGWGFTNVYYFRLGYPEWLTTGSPFE
ncbi:rhodanese-like domain-containing protein [Thiomicrospira microaerophila]|uniref:rhodanese-like domain-containing protein n=1 Tax=Thiomicrospira microaerophila TaxID=406020 RepID=UPI000697A0E8|nr:rhodanese-like domain-containing protein [Thiomicrospira microaerophila]